MGALTFCSPPLDFVFLFSILPSFVRTLAAAADYASRPQSTASLVPDERTNKQVELRFTSFRKKIKLLQEAGREVTEYEVEALEAWEVYKAAGLRVKGSELCVFLSPLVESWSVVVRKSFLEIEKKQ